ncbi:transcription termination factor 4, mitochondrial [Anopheles nili]|uniref:transcription termination factor 4, mitochondrial n=1 Tax=Anopheles nili TaxID=185578 RepID=UPI00237B1AFF|nr:transcription termination factor 4, mitochondrial [Anopheles nili]
MFTRAARFIRSFSSSNNVNKLAENIATSIEGVDKKGISVLLSAVPELTKYSPQQWHQVTKLLATEGMETEKILAIIGGHPTILTRPSEKIVESLHCWRSCQFGDGNMQVLLSAHPCFLEYTNHRQLAQRVAFLHSHFETRKNVYKLFLNAPNLLVEEQHVTQEKITYLMQTMRHEVLDVVKSYAFSYDLEHLRCRHTFLERLGLFKPRSLKAAKTIPTGNPTLYQILDTSDKRFAVKVAYVTLEEYEVFQELFRREIEQRDDYETEIDIYDSDETEIEPSRESYRKKHR